MPEPIITKRCSGCKQFHPICEFHKNRSNPDGLRRYCKSCIKKLHQKPKYKASRNRYKKSEKGKAAERRYHQSKKGMDSYRVRDKTYSAKFPERRKAKNAVHNAVRREKLQPANTLKCKYCHSIAMHYHHYNSYEPKYWFDIEPVCMKCHRILHKKFPSL
ncbi:hypothetical protein LCGC14_3158900 [marine sediment metagenome]|uniref:HNH endonuclease n=1 Tax=marine sediment metagenome TaxID=412755 RepID=A0A0F8XYL4_9ZZZZ